MGRRADGVNQDHASRSVMASYLTIRTSESDAGPVLIVTLPACRFDSVQNAEECKQEIQGLDPTARIAIDLGNAQVVPSLVLSGILRLRKAVRSEGGRLCLCNAGPVVKDMLRVLQLDRLLPIEESLEAAIEAVSAEANR